MIIIHIIYVRSLPAAIGGDEEEDQEVQEIYFPVRKKGLPQ